VRFGRHGANFQGEEISSVQSRFEKEHGGNEGAGGDEEAPSHNKFMAFDSIIPLTLKDFVREH